MKNRPANFVDLTGRHFGRLVVLYQAQSTPDWRTRWRCRCACGKEIETLGGSLRRRRVISCGCYRKERTGSLNRSHAMSKTRLHYIWMRMIRRCHKPTDADYEDYGARGITVCARWRRSFAAFAKDIGPRPTPAHTIDRKDNDKGYSPRNCRWATRKEQANNRRSNIYVKAGGRAVTLAQACEEAGLPYSQAYSRLRAAAYREWRQRA